MNNNERQVDNLLSLLALVRIAPRRIIISSSGRRVSPKQQRKEARISQKKNLLLQTQNKGELAYINGDLAFLAKDYLQALQKYSISISLNFDHKVFLKRGRVNRKLKNYSLALHDCLKFQLEEQNDPHDGEPCIRMAKALLLEGQCRAELCKNMNLVIVFDEIEKAKASVQRAYNMFNEYQEEALKKRAYKYGLRIKKLEWYLHLQEQKENNRMIMHEYIDQRKPTSEEIQQFQKKLDETLPKVGTIPHKYICGITQEIMIDPAVTSAGMAYEKSAIETHIQMNGPRDPIKRCHIQEAVYECHQLKLVLMDYLVENPWAFESGPIDDYQNIRF